MVMRGLWKIETISNIFGYLCMVAGDIALNVENPQIRNVELGSTTINNYPKMGISPGST
jgi:hypothetical protein